MIPLVSKQLIEEETKNIKNKHDLRYCYFGGIQIMLYAHNLY